MQLTEVENQQTDHNLPGLGRKKLIIEKLDSSARKITIPFNSPCV